MPLGSARDQSRIATRLKQGPSFAYEPSPHPPGASRLQAPEGFCVSRLPARKPSQQRLLWQAMPWHAYGKWSTPEERKKTWPKWSTIQEENARTPYTWTEKGDKPWVVEEQNYEKIEGESDEETVDAVVAPQYNKNKRAGLSEDWEMTAWPSPKAAREGEEGAREWKARYPHLNEGASSTPPTREQSVDTDTTASSSTPREGSIAIAGSQPKEPRVVPPRPQRKKEPWVIVEKAEWPKVECFLKAAEDCERQALWRHCWQTSNSITGAHEYSCIPCTALQKGMAYNEARAWVLNFRDPTKRRRERTVRFKEAQEQVRLEFPAMTKNRDIYQMTMKMMATMWTRLSQYILLRKAAEEKKCKDMEEHDRLIAELNSCGKGDKKRADEIIEKIDALDEDDHYLAFAEKEDQERWISASKYDDVWVYEYDKAGRKIGAMASYFVCRSTGPSGGVPCLLTIPSKEWDDDATRAGNHAIDAKKWYCPKCGCKYKATWGQLVIVSRLNAGNEMEYFYMRAEVPNWTAEDIRALYHQDNTAMNCRTPEEFFNKIRKVKPETTTLLVEKEADCTFDAGMLDEEGNKRMYHTIASPAIFNTLPEWQWEQIYNFVGRPAPPSQGSGSRKMKAALAAAEEAKEKAAAEETKKKAEDNGTYEL